MGVHRNAVEILLATYEFGSADHPTTTSTARSPHFADFTVWPISTGPRTRSYFTHVLSLDISPALKLVPSETPTRAHLLFRPQCGLNSSPPSALLHEARRMLVWSIPGSL